MSDFNLKNDRRKAARKASGSRYTEGRANRRDLATNGAFGKEKGNKNWDLCAMGTSAGRTIDV